MHSSGKEDADIDGFNLQLQSHDFDEETERTVEDYQGFQGDMHYLNDQRCDSIGQFPKMDPSPSRMSKLTRRKSEQIHQNRPGPSRQPSKPIERPLSRQKDFADNPKALYLAAQPSSLESETMIIRAAKTSFKDITSPDPVIADESEELSNPHQKSDFMKDNSRSNDLKLSNSDTIMQGQKPYLYPPEFGRPSDISSVVLDEAESVPIDDRSQEIKQFFENTNKKNNMINYGPK